MWRRKLTESISLDEMLHMRESGMTNLEIAKSLDVNVRTVYRYIGPQPAGIGESRRWAKEELKWEPKNDEPGKEVCDKEEPSKRFELDVEMEIVGKSLKDEYIDAEIFYGEKCINFKLGDQKMTVYGYDIQDFSAFVFAVANRFEQNMLNKKRREASDES